MVAVACGCSDDVLTIPLPKLEIVRRTSDETGIVLRSDTG